MAYITGRYAAGVNVTDPVVTDNGGLSGSVASAIVTLYSTSDFTGTTKTYTVPALTFSVLDNSVSYLIADYNNGSPIFRITTDVSEINESNIIPINTLLTLDGHIHLSGWDRVGDGLENKLHRRFVKTQRYAWESGCGLSQNAGVVLIGAGTIWRGGRAFSLLDTYSDGSGSSYWFFFYHSGGAWTHTDSSHTPTAGFNYTQYDNGTNLVSLTGNRCNINWIFRGVEDHQHGYYILSDKDYKDLPTAIAETKIPSLPAHISTHAVLVGRIICQNGVTTPVLIEGAFGASFSPTVINEHNNLSGLQGGTVNQYYHLTEAEHAALTTEAHAQNVFISPTAPVSPPTTYMWVQTQIGPENNFTIWIEDGV